MPSAPPRDRLRARLSKTSPFPRSRLSARADSGLLVALAWLAACSVPPDGGGSAAKKVDVSGEVHAAHGAEGATTSATSGSAVASAAAPAAASAHAAASAAAPAPASAHAAAPALAAAPAGSAHAGAAIQGSAAAEPAPVAAAASAAPVAAAASAAPAGAQPPSSASAGHAAFPPRPLGLPLELGSCPADMVLVGGFCIDRYEAHLVVDASGQLSVHPHYQRPEPGVRYLARNEASVFPQAYISRVEAKAACVASGKRLCTRREWQRACRGDGVHRYPYGPRGERGRCNTGKPHLLRELFGDHPPGGWSYERHFNSPDLNQKPGFLARSGDHAGCASELGVHDMVGNLHEWVSDMVDHDLVQRMRTEGVERRDQPWQHGNGVFMGGFFSTTSELGPGCYFTTIAHEPAYHDYSTGFRCCDSPEPPAAPEAADAKKQDG
ncbi:SUMF1/EgtB/PvdO family nonheme iron enzyme [Sorangium sp. So ce315]|uniref:SUMF1/EgtB/PvdO family nonheme iron enzyme n=1 Tax=Sorangium sp. So ce315 TaxID=3133299 RepID=UPI003F6306EC